MAVEDVAATVTRAALAPPANGLVEAGGPEQFRLDALVRKVLAQRHDPREVITDPKSTYWGIEGVGERTLLPGDGAKLGGIHFDTWLVSQKGNEN